MNSKTEQIATTQTITKIKEQVQIKQWQKDIEDRQTADLSIRLCLLTTFFELHGGFLGVTLSLFHTVVQ